METRLCSWPLPQLSGSKSYKCPWYNRVKSHSRHKAQQYHLFPYQVWMGYLDCQDYQDCFDFIFTSFHSITHVVAEWPGGDTWSIGSGVTADNGGDAGSVIPCSGSDKAKCRWDAFCRAGRSCCARVAGLSACGALADGSWFAAERVAVWEVPYFG